MAKNLFGNLFEVHSEENFKATATRGNLVFGQWDNVYKIWANNIEYDIADASTFRKLITDLSTYVHTEVDGSINRLDTSVSGFETWKKALELAAADNKISIEGVAGDVTVVGSDYVAVSTVDGSIKVSIDASVKHADDEEAADALLATQGYVDQEVEKAAGDVEDLSTYVHKSVDASIDALQAEVADLSTHVDASLKAAVKATALTAAAEAGVATVTLTATKEDDNTDVDAFTVKGDSFVVVSSATDASIKLTAQVSNSKEAIADASTTDNAKLASDFAVKEYVADQIKGLEGALVFKGDVKDADFSTKQEVGNTYVASAPCTVEVGSNSYKLEAGDLLIIKEVDKTTGAATSAVAVERNLDGAVTSSSALTLNKIVLGADNQGVKASEYGIGADSSHTAAEKTVAAEKWVEDVVKDLSTDINKRVTDVSLTVTGDEYINVAAKRDGDTFHIDASVDFVDSKDGIATVTATGKLVDAKAVKDYVDAAGGTLSAKAKTEDVAAEIDLTSAAAAAGAGDLGKVIIKSEDSSLLKVNVAADGSIALDVVAISLADASNGAAGLAIASDVYKELTDVEKTAVESIESVVKAAGLTDGLVLTDDFKAKFGTRDMSQAIIDLSTDLAALDGDLDKKISDAIDASIKRLDVEDASVAGQFVVKVEEVDGKIAVSRAGLKVNGIDAGSDTNGDVDVTIAGSDILVGGNSVHKDSSISKAIADLSTAIDEAGSKIKSIEGETALAGATVNDAFVAVSASEPDEDGKVTLDSSVLLAADVTLSEDLTSTKAAATGLATDKYVADYVTEALAWEVL